MGAQIAAHLTNAGIDTVLFDLPAKEGDKDGIVRKALANLAKLSPAPLASKSLAGAILPANYETGLAELESCDLIIEAIAEKMDWKQDLYRKIAPHVPAHAVLASNTSGLGINALADVLPEELRHRFCGVHFFNPPRYMHLAELIPARTTDQSVLEGLETFLTTQLGKGVVYAKDRQGRLLIGNRATSELIGRPPEAYIGRTDAELLGDPAQAAAVMATDARIMASGRAEQIEEVVDFPDGRQAWWLSTKAPLRDADGRVVGRHRSTGIARPRFWDRARYYGLERELAEALDAAE